MKRELIIKIAVVSLVGVLFAGIFILVVSLISYVVDIKPDFGIAAILMLTLREARDTYNEIYRKGTKE